MKSIRFFVFIASCSALSLAWWGCSPPSPESEKIIKDGGTKDNGTKDSGTKDSGTIDQKADGGTKKDDAKPKGPTYHGNVRAILEGRCTNCHSKGGIGPFKLTTYSKVFAYRSAIKQSVEERTMPPWSAGKDCNDYQGDFSLSDEEIKTISEWVKTGAREGDPKSFKSKNYKKMPKLSRVDLTIKTPVYSPLKKPDDYRCFVLEWPYKKDKYITGFQVKPGNKGIAHHLIAYLGSPKNAQYYRNRDKKEKGLGYTCFNGPGRGGALGAPWIGAWAPGTLGTDYPKGTGLLIKPGSVVIVQMHYNSANAKKGETDQTAFEMKIDDKVEKEAFILPFTDFNWLQSGMKIPAGNPSVTHVSNPLNVGGFLFKKNYTIYSANIHMHVLGSKGKLFLKKQDGKEQCLLNIPKYSFDWQLNYRFKKPIEVVQGTSTVISCTWNNSQENQAVVNGKKGKPRNVAWGDGTFDEMCLGMMYVTCKDANGKPARCR